MLVKEQKEMEKTLIGLRSYREDILNTQDVVAPRQEGSYQNKIEDVEDEVQMLKISYEDQKLYEVKEQLNKLKDEFRYAKNAICSR